MGHDADLKRFLEMALQDYNPYVQVSEKILKVNPIGAYDNFVYVDNPRTSEFNSYLKSYKEKWRFRLDSSSKSNIDEMTGALLDAIKRYQRREDLTYILPSYNTGGYAFKEFLYETLETPWYSSSGLDFSDEPFPNVYTIVTYDGYDDVHKLITPELPYLNIIGSNFNILSNEIILDTTKTYTINFDLQIDVESVTTNSRVLSIGNYRDTLSHSLNNQLFKKELFDLSLSINTWYNIQLKTDFANDIIKLYIDSVFIEDLALLDTLTETISYIDFVGTAANLPTSQWTTYIHNFRVYEVDTVDIGETVPDVDAINGDTCLVFTKPSGDNVSGVRVYFEADAEPSNAIVNASDVIIDTFTSSGSYIINAVNMAATDVFALYSLFTLTDNDITEIQTKTIYDYVYTTGLVNIKLNQGSQPDFMWHNRYNRVLEIELTWWS